MRRARRCQTPPVPRRLHPRHRIDASWRDAAYALAACAGLRHDPWPRQSRAEYASKVLKCAAALALSAPRVYGIVAHGGRGPAALVRTISAGDDDAFRRWLRRQPSLPLVAVLRRRLCRFPAGRLPRRAQAGDALAAALRPARFRPGWAAAGRSTHWLFPVVSDDPVGLIAGLNAAELEATQGTSQIAAVAPEPPAARWIIAGIVLVPVYPEMPTPERERLALVINRLVAGPDVREH